MKTSTLENNFTLPCKQVQTLPTNNFTPKQASLTELETHTRIPMATMSARAENNT